MVMVDAMIADWFNVQFAGLWSIIWHFGLAGVLILGCAVGAYFSPTLKNKMCWIIAAIVVAVFSVAVAIGVNLGEKRIQAQWDAARVVTVDKAKKARAGAVRDVARKPSRWLPNRRDPDLRD